MLTDLPNLLSLSRIAVLPLMVRLAVLRDFLAQQALI